MEPKTNISEEAKILLECLTDEEKQQIRRENPFKLERNEAIRKLRARGVMIPVLVELTGFSRNAIHYISKGITVWAGRKRHKNAKA